MNHIKELCYMGINQRIGSRKALLLIADWIKKQERAEQLNFETFKKINKI